MPARTLFVIEPFCGGSHAVMVRFLAQLAGEGAVVTTCSLPAKKWEWRLRASSLWLAQHLPAAPENTTLFVSSMANLAELLGVRPDLAQCHKVLYFHENQLSYPTRSGPEGAVLTEGAADFGSIWAQITSAVAADVCAFNSLWNLRSFIALIERHLNVIPDKAQRPSGIRELLAQKCVVAYFPVPAVLTPPPAGFAVPPGAPLTILWNHRWEYDKAPEAFFGALRHLVDRGVCFRVAVLGERFGEAPPVFDASRPWLDAGGHILHWGYVPDAEAYRRIVASCDVAVSTAVHEFFGVSLVEAALLGCAPLAPARLAYPELFAPLPAELAATEEGAVCSFLDWRLRQSAVKISGTGGERGRGDATDPPPLDLSAFTAPGPARGRLQDAVDLRRSPWLYRSDAELRRRLIELAQRPEFARAWKRRLYQEASGRRSAVDIVDKAEGSSSGNLTDGTRVVLAAVGIPRVEEDAASAVAEALPGTEPPHPLAETAAAAGAVDENILLLRSLLRLEDRTLFPLYRALLRLPSPPAPTVSESEVPMPPVGVVGVSG